MKRGDPLSGRERDVLTHMIAGKSDVQIGVALGLSDNTVRTHVRRAEKKLGVHGRVQLAIRLVRLMPCAKCIAGHQLAMLRDDES